MPKLTLSVRIAAGSILLLSSLHILFWASLAFYVAATGLNNGQFTLLFVALCMISVGGIAGAIVAAGIFKMRSWARVAALVLAAITGTVCAFALLVLSILIFADPGSFGFLEDFVANSRNGLLKIACIYFMGFSAAIWWITLFSRKSVSEQFDHASEKSPVHVSSKRRSCPPPIALLAWLMIVCAGLSAVSWPLILGKIPAMLFTHVFSMAYSKWIWAANVGLFLICGIGLLKLQRWSYSGAIALHVFWLVSMFVSQISPLYEPYVRICLNALEIPQTYPGLSLPRFSSWPTAIVSALPTALLVAGLFCYRPSFLRAADDSHQPTL